MRKRIVPLALVALAGLFGSARTASAQNCGAATYSGCSSSPCCDAQSNFSCCQQQCRPGYRLVYDNVLEKRWQTCYKNVNETVMRQVTKTCYKTECQTCFKNVTETCYRTVMEERCKP